MQSGVRNLISSATLNSWLQWMNNRASRSEHVSRMGKIRNSYKILVGN